MYGGLCIENYMVITRGWGCYLCVWTGRNEEEDTNNRCSFDVGVYEIFALCCQASFFISVLQDDRHSRRTANLLLFGLFSVEEISQKLLLEDKLSSSKFDIKHIQSKWGVNCKWFKICCLRILTFQSKCQKKKKNSLPLFYRKTTTLKPRVQNKQVIVVFS